MITHFLVQENTECSQQKIAPVCLEWLFMQPTSYLCSTSFFKVPNAEVYFVASRLIDLWNDFTMLLMNMMTIASTQLPVLGYLITKTS